MLLMGCHCNSLNFIILTLHDCPSQMNENLLISNSKLTSDSELIWWRLSTNLSSFVRDSYVGCVLYNGKDNHYQIRSWIQIMPNVRVLSNHERVLLAHPCTFGEKIARFGIYLVFKWLLFFTNHKWLFKNSWIYIIQIIFRHLITSAVSK